MNVLEFHEAKTQFQRLASDLGLCLDQHLFGSNSTRNPYIDDQTEGLFEVFLTGWIAGRKALLEPATP